MKLFVANIERRVSEEELKNLFTECGEVTTAKIITDRATGVPKGFGFIEMPSDMDAQTAIDTLNERILNGRALSVKQAKPKTQF